MGVAVFLDGQQDDLLCCLGDDGDEFLRCGRAGVFPAAGASTVCCSQEASSTDGIRRRSVERRVNVLGMGKVG
jgi:hypothetical protein